MALRVLPLFFSAILAAGLLGAACNQGGAHGAAGACRAANRAGVLPMSASGWVSASSNAYCIQGAWAWSSDAQTGGQTTLTGPVNSSAPYVMGSGMCLRGSTPGGAADNYKTWGASVQLNLNQASPTSAPMPLESSPSCFTITISGGSPGGLTGFLCPASSGQSMVCPQVALSPGPNEVCVNNIALPSWCTSNSSTGQTCLDASQLASGIQSVGVEANSGAGGPIDFCVTSIVPHDAPPAVGGNDAAADSGALDAGLIAGRPYMLHVPTGYDPSRPTPLVVVLHGYASDAASAENGIFHLTAASDSYGFLYLLPDGTVDTMGNRFWNATDACCNFYGSHVDDVAYLNAALTEVESKYTVDLTRVFVGGHSNGAMMAQVFACKSARRIAAVFSYAGALWANTALCMPNDVVPMVELHGDMDPMVPYQGGVSTVYPATPAYPSAALTVGTWASLDQCSGGLEDDGEAFDLVPSLPGSETTVAKAALCARGIDVELWTIHGGSHQDTLNATTFGQLVWTFFSTHPKQSP